jgi:hypothetical protein
MLLTAPLPRSAAYCTHCAAWTQRRHLKKGDLIMDCLLVWCCPHCVIMQNANEVGVRARARARMRAAASARRMSARCAARTRLRLRAWRRAAAPGSARRRAACGAAWDRTFRSN